MDGFRDEDLDDLGPSELKPWVEPGGYVAMYEDRETRPYHYGERLIVYWRLYLTSDLSKPGGVVLCRYYPLRRDGGGRFLFGHHHGYRIDWIAANYGRHPAAVNKLPLTVFKEKKVIVEVKTVIQGETGPLPKGCHYSRISRIVRPVEEGESFERFPLQLHRNVGK